MLIGMGRLVARGTSIVLVRPRPDDEEEFLRGVHASRPLHDRWVAPPSTPAAYAAYLRRIRRTDNAGFLVRDGASGDICGVVNVNSIVRGALQSGFLGYYGFAGGAGRGSMTEGVLLTCGHAFERLGLHRLEANIQPENLRSIALVRRCGFTREGFSPHYLNVAGAWRDHERWAITVESFSGGVTGDG